MPEADLPDIDALWNFQDPAATEQTFRDLVDPATEAADNSYLAELLTQIARTQGLQRRFDDADRDLDQAEAMIGTEESRQRVRLLLERGRVLNSSGHPADALPLFVASFEMAQRCSEEALAVDAAHMVAIAEEPEQALEWNLRALAMSQSSREQRAINWQGSLLNNIGWTYHDMGRYDDALEYFQAGLEFHRSMKRDPETRIAAWTVARCLRSLGRTQEALAMQQANLESAQEANAPDGFIQEELGECLLDLGRESDAEAHFTRAFEVLSNNEWLVANEPHRIARLQRLGSGSP
jgi:tetratricopeptide (TPR) repeat protein